jgi:enoyl-CoA hydratase
MAEDASYKTIKVDHHGTHVQVTLWRADVRNAIDAVMVAELHDLCARLEDRPSALIVTGAGTVFASGADLREMRERGRADALRGINSGLFDRLAHLPMPTVAAVNGPAIGGGAELAYACDFRVASSSARFGNPEVSLGIMPAAGACWRLRELVGTTVAREVLLAGRVLDAADALRTGLVSSVVEPDDLISAAEELVERISRGVPLAIQLTKLALAAPAEAHPRFDDVAQAVLFETEEKRWRMTAFLERRA